MSSPGAPTAVDSLFKLPLERVHVRTQRSRRGAQEGRPEGRGERGEGARETLDLGVGGQSALLAASRIVRPADRSRRPHASGSSGANSGRLRARIGEHATRGTDGAHENRRRPVARRRLWRDARHAASRHDHARGSFELRLVAQRAVGGAPDGRCGPAGIRSAGRVACGRQAASATRACHAHTFSACGAINEIRACGAARR